MDDLANGITELGQSLELWLISKLSVSTPIQPRLVPLDQDRFFILIS
jgi:hypothetical protein